MLRPLAAVVLLGAAHSLAAQAAPTPQPPAPRITEERRGLLAEAKVAPDAAIAIACAVVKVEHERW